MTSDRSLSLIPCQRLADSLARAPNLLNSLPSACLQRLQQSIDMVAEREMKSSSSNRQRKPTCGRSKLEQLKSQQCGDKSQGRRLYDSCVSALGHLEDQLLDEMEQAGEEVRVLSHFLIFFFHFITRQFQLIVLGCGNADSCKNSARVRWAG